MSLTRRLWLPLVLLLSCPAAAHAFDGGAWTVHRGEWYSEVSGSRLSAADRFLANGDESTIANDGRFQQFQLRSYNEIGWLSNVSLLLDIPFTNRTFRNGGQSVSVSGLSDARLGLRLRLREDAPGLVLEAGWRAPLGYDKNLFPNLGDGRQKAFASLHGGLQLPMMPAFVQASRGILFVSEDGVIQSQTRVDAAGWLGNSVLVGARYFDNVDWNSTTAAGEQTAIYAAGPVVLVRIDDHIDLSMGVFQSFAGHNAYDGTDVYIALGMKQTKLNPLQGFLGSRARP